MVDQRITNILTPKVADSAAPLSRGEVALKIITTTQDLQSVRRPMRLDGVISAVSKDGSSATIQTAKGDVTVQLRNNTPVQEGQNVQIDVPAGSPPRQTIMRPAPDTNPQPTQNQPQTTPTQGGTTQTPATPIETPVAQGSQPPSNGQTPTPPQTQQPAPSTSGNAQQPATPPAATTTQAALPTEVRAILDQAAPLPPSIPTTQPLASLPPNAIVRLIPLTSLPATIDLLPVPTAIQALIDAAPLKPDLLAPAALKTPLASDEFASPLEPKPLSMLGQTQPAATPKAGTRLIATPVTSPFDVKILSIQPNAGFKTPTLPGAEPTATPVQPKIFADVLAVTKQNFPIVSMTLPGAKAPQIFMLQFPATNIEPGTRLEILPVPVATGTATSAASQNLLTGWTWPALDDAVSILTHSMPQAQMAQTLANVLPSPAKPVVMPPAMQFFIAVIQSGDIASWFGDKAISALRRDSARGGDTLSRLTQDVDTLGRSMDTPAQDWKGVAIPLVWQSEIQKIHLYYKHQDAEKEEDQEKGERTTRFIFDLNLTRLGDIQLDGLMKTERLDLILRTGTMFSHGMQTAMRKKYQSVLELGNLTGDLVFQNRMDQWVHVKVNAKKSNLGASA